MKTRRSAAKGVQESRKGQETNTTTCEENEIVEAEECVASALAALPESVASNSDLVKENGDQSQVHSNGNHENLEGNITIETIDSSQAATASTVDGRSIALEATALPEGGTLLLDNKQNAPVEDQQTVQFHTVDIQNQSLTPFTTGENSATLLYLLNASSFPPGTEAVTLTVGSSSGGSLPSTMLVPQSYSTVTTTSSTTTVGSSVIEKAMDLADLDEATISSRHPATNAALTLVSLGSVTSNLMHEVVVDESGNSSSFLSSTPVEGPSVTVDSMEVEQSPQGNTNQENNQDTQQQQSQAPTQQPQGTVTQVSFSKVEVCRVREVITQTGDEKEEVIVGSIREEQRSTKIGQLSIKKSNSKTPADDRTRDHECPTCAKRFFTKNDLKRHGFTHSTERPYSCEVCQKAFRTTNEVKLHMAIHVSGTPYKCEYCGKEFRTKGCIKAHIKYHIGDKRHKCSICGHAFVKSADLKRHVAAHNNEKNYKCPECGSAFTRQDNLKAHMMLHSRQGVVSCDKCHKEFINQIYLKRHMHIHKEAKKKPYECQWCPKTYENLEGLRRHIKQHVGDEKFVCEQCDKKFITAIQLKRHLWLSHEEGSPYRRSIL
ncbi:zinc finger and BTB domain-containing protein 17 [Nematostella vectensis]|uniref:zinc finger and BTB domain-containing protein 17 n=1 Tax=Nematostella vectensis TaxID=45351 RepID=UPI00138FACDC|nr:zinc finger and BTB domain-containing protein 17 [Nematostella vectensis]